jgi:hypothetical protein
MSLWAFFSCPALAQLVGSWNVTVSPTNGGSQTVFSFYATGDWLTGFPADFDHPPPTPTAGPYDYIGSTMFESGPGGGAPQAWNVTNDIGALVEPLGYITNITQGLSESLNVVAIDYNQEFNMSILFIGGTGTLPVFKDDTLAYVFNSSPSQIVMDQNFSTFIPGSYSVRTNTTAPKYLQVVPEPSTYALLLMTGAGALWWARRRR